MSELDKAALRFKMRFETEKKDYQASKKKYKGDFKSRSGLSSEDFNNRKSAGRYSWK